jgi:hypothetical protein
MTKRLFLLGFLLLGVYVSYVLSLGDPRAHDGSFQRTFFITFALYAGAVWLILRNQQPATTHQIILSFAFGIAFRAILVFSMLKPPSPAALPCGDAPRGTPPRAFF